MTITWPVDDLNISHVNSKVVSDTMLWLESIHRKMNGTRGKLHEYLVM